MKNNYDILYKKMSNAVQSWNHRSLTKIGKIQILNTIVTSLTTPKFSVLPTPEKGILR